MREHMKELGPKRKVFLFPRSILHEASHARDA
jgi:hypothetical protein